MAVSINHALSRAIFYLLILASGFASLSWEVLWQIKATLALGASASGAAITLAVMMGGMSLGSLLMGYRIHHLTSAKAIRVYGLLECIIGIAGIFLTTTFRQLEKLDSGMYINFPQGALLSHLFGIISVLAIPSLCMGATFPLYGYIGKQLHLSIAKLYSLNTLGAASGVLCVAFIFIPFMGIQNTINTIATMNMSIAMMAWLFALIPQPLSIAAEEVKIPALPLTAKELMVVLATGFATFTLEVAWFRSFAATFPNTTDVFAIMLVSVLIALGLAAKNVSRLKQRKKSLGAQICCAGILILVTTPLIERFDTFFMYSTYTTHHAITTTNPLNAGWLLNPTTLTANSLAGFLYIVQVLVLFFVLSLVIVPTLHFLGIAFPWLADNPHSPRSLGKLYAINTFAAIIGAMSTAWFLLPTIGFAKAAWIAGIVVMVAGLIVTPGRKRWICGILGTLAFLFAARFESGIGKTRIQGLIADDGGRPAIVLASYEGPESTISAIQYQDGGRALLINSASAAAESGLKMRPSIHYMAWMGHLPMLLQVNPQNALVICFGSGQTANAVRNENPASLDIVDVNPHVFKLAPYFKSNEKVLNDHRVKTIVMDGRAYLRRTQKTYDVITLEPMPPVTIGMNALYSLEFYRLARTKLTLQGIIAQWLPFHAVAPHYAASIAKTFIEVFPNAILWIDPDSKNGILLGTKEEATPLTTAWPGFTRNTIQRNLSLAEVQHNVSLNAAELQRYGAYGEIITDDNQLLAYGKVLHANVDLMQKNLELVQQIRKHIH